MGADVEYEIARPDEGRVEASHAPLPKRNGVIDRQRPRESDGAIKSTHTSPS